LAAADALEYRAIGTDSDRQYFAMAKQAFQHLSALDVNNKVRQLGDRPQPR
jgi:hypothetical protein